MGRQPRKAESRIFRDKPLRCSPSFLKASVRSVLRGRMRKVLVGFLRGRN